MIPSPFLLYLGAGADPIAIKSARGMAYWRPEVCLGERRTAADAQSLGLESLGYREAAERGARTVIVGVANRGGVMSGEDEAEMQTALEAGLNIASGLHQRLADRPKLVEAARANGCQLFDLRTAPKDLPVGDGERRAGLRLLTVGTDCSVGKMYTSLAIERELKRRQIRCDFRATGQTGIMIAGAGVPVDAVVADFISGAIEQLSPARTDGGMDIIEGQGSLFHPSYAGVSLGLLHGAQPDAIVLCHEVGRPHMRGLSGRDLPSLADTLEANLEAARVTNPDVVAVGVSLNTSRLSSSEAEQLFRAIEDDLGLPAEDPVTTGVGRIADRIQECIASLQLMESAGP